MICNVSDVTGQLDSLSYRSSVQCQTGFSYSRQGHRSQCPYWWAALVPHSIVNHLSPLADRLLSALATRLELHSCWTRCEISRSLIFWLLPVLLWRQPPSVPWHSSRLTIAPSEPAQTPIIVRAVVHQVLWECQ